MYKIPQYIIISLLSVCSLFAQNSEENIYKNFSSPSFLQQNKYLINPTFTFVNSKSSSISLFSRNSFVGFDNSPQLNIASFSGKVNTKVGAGIAIFQQNIGVFTSFGAIANYAYNIKLNTNSNLTLGFNFIFNKNYLDRSRIITSNPDPLINNFQESLNIILQPAINYNIGKFDFGIFLKDFVDYNIKTKQFITPFSDKIISGHAMFTQPIKISSTLFKDSFLQFLITVNNNNKSKFSSHLLFDLPKAGWVQTGYDDFFGFSAGLGFKLSEKIAISYVYENGKNVLGSISEIGIKYSFSKKRSNKKEYKITENIKKTAPKVIKQKKPISKKPTSKNISETQFTKEFPKIATLKKTKDLDIGYYLIVNVFSVKKYADNFIKKLKKEKLDPKYFIHPLTKNRYIYLYQSTKKLEVFEQFKSDLEGKYVHEKWIMKVEN